MHVKDLLDSLDIRVKLPQHWYSTDISNDFEDGELIQNDEIREYYVDFLQNTMNVAKRYQEKIIEDMKDSSIK